MRSSQRRILRQAVFALGLVAVAGAQFCCAPDEPGQSGDPDATCGLPLEGVVERVVDGDTIKLQGGARVRYLLIDTPELNGGDPDCLAEEATELNEQLVAGKTVRFEYDPVQCVDVYDRRLAYVFVDDVMVNETLVRRGFAEAFIYYAEGASGEYLYAEQIEDAEDVAREEGRGIWSLCNDEG